MKATDGHGPADRQGCPCGSEATLAECCGLLLGGAEASTAEALMRSRYSAYVLGDESYLRQSWHPDYVPKQLGLDPRQRWLGLKIKRVLAGGVGDNTGEVEFAARYKIDGRGHRLEERSRFERLQGRWVYLDGALPVLPSKPTS